MRTHPDAPWLVAQAVEFLSKWLRPTDVGFEWGSGRSTIWFAKRVRRLISVEHDKQWVDIVLRQLGQLQNVELCYRQLEPNDGWDYIGPIQEICPDESLDFCLVDGRLRERCAVEAVSKVKPGGLLILDNVDRYLPSDDSTPSSRRDYQNEIWTTFHKEMVAEWRYLQFSNGVSTTGIWVKPA